MYAIYIHMRGLKRLRDLGWAVYSCNPLSYRGDSLRNFIDVLRQTRRKI